MRLSEFAAAMRSFVGGDSDSRHIMVEGLLQLSGKQIVECMGSEDFAANISFAAAGRLARPVQLALVGFDEDDEAQVAQLAALFERYPPEIIVDPAHVALGKLLEEMKELEGGRTFIAEVAACLARGRSMKGIGPHIYDPNKFTN